MPPLLMVPETGFDVVEDPEEGPDDPGAGQILAAIKMNLELIGIHMPEASEPVREALERSAKDRQKFDLEHRLLLPDGAVKHLHVVAHAVTGERGQVDVGHGGHEG